MQVNVLTRVAHPANQDMASPRKRPYPERNEGAVLRGSRDHFIQSQFEYTCATPDAEYDLRFDADEEYLRELIDRIDGMSLRGVKLCNRCTEKHPGKWQGKLGRARCADCERNVERHFVLQKAAAVARRTSRGIG